MIGWWVVFGYVLCLLVALLVVVLFGFLCVDLSLVVWVGCGRLFVFSFCLFMFVGIRHSDVVLYWLLIWVVNWVFVCG